MDFWPEFLASSWGKEFVAGGFGGVAGIISGYPLDTLRIRQQQNSNSGSALSILRRVIGTEGPAALYRGMAAPLASVTFQVDAAWFEDAAFTGFGCVVRDDSGAFVAAKNGPLIGDGML